MNEFYPEITPFNHFMLDVGEGGNFWDDVTNLSSLGVVQKPSSTSSSISCSTNMAILTLLLFVIVCGRVGCRVCLMRPKMLVGFILSTKPRSFLYKVGYKRRGTAVTSAVLRISTTDNHTK